MIRFELNNVIGEIDIKLTGSSKRTKSLSNTKIFIYVNTVIFFIILVIIPCLLFLEDKIINVLQLIINIQTVFHYEFVIFIE